MGSQVATRPSSQSIADEPTCVSHFRPRLFLTHEGRRERVFRHDGVSAALARTLRRERAPVEARRRVDNTRVRNTNVSENNFSRARTFGHTLRETRRQTNVSQDDLARLSGVDRSAISNYERGRREPNLRTIVKLARAMNVSPSSLLRDL